MTKKHFIELANILRSTRPETMPFLVASSPSRITGEAETKQWEKMRDELMAFCIRNNSNFDKQKFLNYIG